jgi:hypothetical protein
MVVEGLGFVLENIAFQDNIPAILSDAFSETAANFVRMMTATRISRCSSCKLDVCAGGILFERAEIPAVISFHVFGKKSGSCLQVVFRLHGLFSIGQLGCQGEELGIEGIGKGRMATIEA